MINPGFRTSFRLVMHDGIKQALAVGAGPTDGKAKPYGVLAFPDWKRITDPNDEELAKRGVKSGAASRKRGPTDLWATI